MTIPVFHPDLTALAFLGPTQLNLFEQFLTQAVRGIDSTSITSGMQNVGYVVLVVGFLWQVYQSALHGGDVRGLGTNLIKYVATALVLMNYPAVFTTINQGFVNAGNWIGDASGGLNLLDNWGRDIQTQFSQVGFQQMWGLVTGSVAGLIDAILILVAYILYPFVVVLFGFFYILYGSVLYIFGPLVISLMPLGVTNRIAKAYVENMFIWNAWPILYGGFGALLSAVQMGQVGQMLSQNNFLGGLGSLEGSFLLGFASIIFSLAIAVIPLMAKRIVSGDVGSTAGALIGAAVTALTAGTAAIEGAAVGTATAGAGSSAGSTGGAGGGAGAVRGANSSAGMGIGNQPVSAQRGSNPGSPTSILTGYSATGGDSSSDTPAFAGGTEAWNEDGPTADGHAGRIRGALMGAGGEEGTAGAGGESAGGMTDIGSGTGQASSPRGGAFGSVIRGNPWSWRSRPPNPRWEGLASWGAYHAARVATHAMATAARTTEGDRDTSN
jgi:hypothetical protein